jgi:hypothetical protein
VDDDHITREPHKTIIEDLMELGEGEGIPRASFATTGLPGFTDAEIEQAIDDLLAEGTLQQHVTAQGERILVLRSLGTAGPN